MPVQIIELSRETNSTGIAGHTAVFHKEELSPVTEGGADSPYNVSAQAVDLLRSMTLYYCLGCPAQHLGRCGQVDIDLVDGVIRVAAHGQEGVFEGGDAACQKTTDSL